MKPGDLVRNASHDWLALLIEYSPYKDQNGAGLCTIQWIEGPDSLRGKIDKCHSSMLKEHEEDK